MTDVRAHTVLSKAPVGTVTAADSAANASMSLI
jgi:hypothetical protein